VPLIRKPIRHTPAALPELKGLESNSADERWAAARAAPEVPGSSVALVTALRKEPDSRVREAMFTALARIGSPEGVAQLVSLLRSDTASLRTGALGALRTLTRNNHDFLPELLQDSDKDVRILSCELARGLAAEEASVLLGDLLRSEREINVCAAAVDVLSEVGGPTALPALAECARRFANAPFLVFAIQVATERISAQIPRARD
jgi:HEAT repeat protein